MQSVLFGCALFGITVVLLIASFILGHIPILGWLVMTAAWMIFGVSFLIIWIVGFIKALSNVEWEIPYLGKLARKQLATQTLV